VPPSETSLRRIEGVGSGNWQRSKSRELDVRALEATNLIGIPEEAVVADTSKLELKEPDFPEDITILLSLQDVDKNLEKKQTCHRCGKKGKSGKLVCKSSFCALNGKRFCICEGCLARLEKEMSTKDFRCMMGDTSDPDWHCPRCIQPHFLRGAGICCCSFSRRGMMCPWHRSTPRLCCSSARVAVNKRHREKINVGVNSEREKLCNQLNSMLQISKIRIVSRTERCYEGFPCKRCTQTSLVKEEMPTPNFVSRPLGRVEDLSIRTSKKIRTRPPSPFPMSASKSLFCALSCSKPKIEHFNIRPCIHSPPPSMESTEPGSFSGGDLGEKMLPTFIGGLM